MVKNFEEYRNISKLIKEQIELGNVEPYQISHRLYKSGDYICSSFKIDNRDIVVSSLLINDSDIKYMGENRHHKTLSYHIKQFGISSSNYIWVGFSEFINGKENSESNTNDNSTLFRKMKTIIDIIKDFVNYYQNSYIIFQSVGNDLESGMNKDYNKRDKFYEIFFTYNNVKSYMVKSYYELFGVILSDFFILKTNYYEY
jgi:hypothetical protein